LFTRIPASNSFCHRFLKVYMIGTNFLHAIKFFLGIEEAQTRTTPKEMEFLELISKGRKSVVEIGVFEGAGSLGMRRAMSPDANLYLIDPFPRGKFGFCSQELIARRNIKRSRNGNVTFIRDFSFNAVRSWEVSIDLLFWDAVIGDYDAVNRDFVEWSPKLESKGLYLIHASHDCVALPVKKGLGARAFVEDLPRLHPGFENLGSVDSISIIARCGTRLPEEIADFISENSSPVL
jgi:hypothetical protein